MNESPIVALLVFLFWSSLVKCSNILIGDSWTSFHVGQPKLITGCSQQFWKGWWEPLRSNHTVNLQAAKPKLREAKSKTLQQVNVVYVAKFGWIGNCLANNKHVIYAYEKKWICTHNGKKWPLHYKVTFINLSIWADLADDQVVIHFIIVFICKTQFLSIIFSSHFQKWCVTQYVCLSYTTLWHLHCN